MKKLLVILLSVLCLSGLMLAQTEKQVGAKVLTEDLGKAFVTLQVDFTISMSFTMWEEDYNEEYSEKMQLLPVTIISKDGLAISVSGADVKSGIADEMEEMLESQGMSEYVENFSCNVQVEKMVYVMADGREIPAEIAYVDVQNDVSVLRPVEKAGGDFTFIDVKNSATPELLTEILTPLRTIAELGHPLVVVPDYITGIASEPKDYYIAGRNTRNLTDGITCFTVDGKFIGMQVGFKANLGRDSQNFIEVDSTEPTVILPAKYIVEILGNVK